MKHAVLSIRYINFGKIVATISALLLTFNVSYLHGKKDTAQLAKAVIVEQNTVEILPTDTPVIVQTQSDLTTGDEWLSVVKKMAMETVTTSPPPPPPPPIIPDLKRMTNYPKNKKNMLFPLEARGSCSRRENLPPAIWETEEDWESGTWNHLAVWFCKTIPSQKDRLQKIKFLLNELTNTFDHYGLEYWLDRGTLLGSVRNETLIPWDSDADIGISFETLKEMMSLVFSPKFKFNCSDCTLLFRKGKHSHVIPFKFISITTGIYIDAFLYFRDDLGGVPRLTTHWPLKPAVENRWIVHKDILFPLVKKCRIDESLYWCPYDSEEYTSLWYGEDWRTPRF